jgi:alpha-L-rhamnosidase
MKKTLLTLAIAATTPLHAVEVEKLRCEYLENPLAVDVAKPRLGWVLEDDERGQKQTAFQILVASSPEILAKDQGDLWDSGKVAGDQSIQVEYAGKPLGSRAECFWKVRVWDKDGEVSDWSQPALWAMGVMKPEDWAAKWIKSDLELFAYQKELKQIPDFQRQGENQMWEAAPGIRRMTEAATEAPAVYLRKEFSTESGQPAGVFKEIKRAVARISGLGFYELYLNGKKVDDHYFNTAPYDFTKAVPYQAHDVTKLMEEGENCVGAILGNGYFNPVIPSVLREYIADYIDTPRLRFDLLIEYADGSRQSVVSDQSWKFTTNGPIRFNSVRAGETYDARMELGDWSKKGFDADAWKPALPAEAPAGELASQNIPPVRTIAEIPAVSVAKEGNGYRFDIGVESTGWAKLKVRGKPGQKITLRYPGAGSHTLGRYQECEYICKGDGEETFEPRFAFNGYRLVDVFGLDYEPKPSDLVGCLVASDLPPKGSFSCSNPQLNKIHEVVLRTIQNYNIQIPMDPVREKVGWTQDVQSNFKASAYNFDVGRIYSKWQDDFTRAVEPDGYVPPVLPSRFSGPGINGPWWGGMIIYGPWQLYNFYGDRSVLERSYEPMKHYMRYLDSIAKGNVVSWGLGDWLDTTIDGNQDHPPRPKNTTVPFTSTCAYLLYNDILRQTALLLGKPEEAAQFAARAGEIRATINARFFDPATGVYDKGSQTAYVLALLLDVPAPADRARVLGNLKARIASDNFHVRSGFVGIPFLLTFLTENGMGDLAWKIATQPDHPGWFDMVFTRNNSVLKEDWAGKMVQMPSLAAPIDEWFYRSLGGIRPDAPGFKGIVIQPYTETLEWVNCHHDSPYGRIASNWKREAGKLTMDVAIPPNTTATVFVPAKDAASVTESGKPAGEAEGVKFLRMENNAAVYAVGSGSYQFQSQL